MQLFAAIKNVPDIIEEVKQKDPEELARIRKARNLNILMHALSALSFVFLFIGSDYPLLFAFIPLCSAITTAFYIRYQQYVRFDGTRQGKTSIFFAYFINPIFTALFAWFVIPGMFELNCLSNHIYSWLAGLFGTVVFLLCVFGLLEESRKSIYMKIGMPFIAIVFGLQITAIMLAIIHF